MGGILGKHGSFIIDHTMDEIPLHKMTGSLSHGTIPAIICENTAPAYQEDHTRLLEIPREKVARKRSHLVAYTTMFVMSIGFSIVLSGVWPYLKEELVPSLSKTSLGWVVAANPLGQMIGSPIVGLWGNKSGSIRLPCYITLSFFVLGNVMYSLLASFKGLGEFAPYYAMIVARFMTGVSSANIVLSRSYLAASTTVEERTIVISILSGSQALGFVIGPGIQAVLTILIPNEVDTGIDWLLWNKFTAAGWVAGALGLINLVLYLPCIFKEYNIAEKERALLKASMEKDDQIKLPKPDHLALIGILFSFFTAVFIYVLLETLAVPFVMDQYAWTEDKAMIVIGAALSVGGLICIFMFALNGILAKRYDERTVMIILGLVPIVVGTFIFLPWGDARIPIQTCTTDNDTVTTEMTTIATSEEMQVYDYENMDQLLFDKDTEDCGPGCPTTQIWCTYTPQLPLAQLIVAYVIVIIGYPVATGINQSIFSKLVGPKPQGIWMSIITVVGSFSRVMGPVFVSYVYTDFGTRWCFGFLTISMVLTLVEMCLLYKRLIPMKIPELGQTHAYDGPAAEKY
ncbi:major facilitator superfamily domain-containing protein 8-like isoform X1 [Homarus americanus]|uniref:Major facilitator superfamily domain-containing protein 8-like 2 n=1 Tax=Homarus americanus TaxID=6706 RepID=A0A8J5JQL7_HOMAM|nr:major facilitator superfamily domain-containing protein 8-like isoform X1 [Homarus americanus]XP_042237061.1 major facilitator superfamily domain-containing protein 8-like isoform X1 [Homarus americanus]KAG7160541.1 Major facilitator superfamily domain-containing protein 8-like 2 [Homarus americanus]